MINLFIDLQINLYYIDLNNKCLHIYKVLFKIMVRHSPDEHAREFKNIIKLGNNSNLWVSKPDINQVYKWKELKNSYNIYKIYCIIKQENNKIKIKYNNINKLIKQLSNKIKLEQTKYFLDNLHHVIESFNNEYKTSDYLGDDGWYGRYIVDDELKSLIEKYNTQYYFIINDLDIFLYFQTKTLFIYGYILDYKIVKELKKTFLEIFKNYIVKFYISKNQKSCFITITDK